jgi:hypothetical protein
LFSSAFWINSYSKHVFSPMNLPGTKPKWSKSIILFKTVLNLVNFQWIQNWVKIFYRNIVSSVNQGGNLSEFFNIEQGFRQGDPFPRIFSFSAKVLAINLTDQQNCSILLGFFVKKILYQWARLQYHLQIVITYFQYLQFLTFQLLQKSLEELNSFADLSGLNINYTKTQVVWIGSQGFKWGKIMS